MELQEACEMLVHIEMFAALEIARSNIRERDFHPVLLLPRCSGEMGRRDFRDGCDAKIMTGQ
jgi:hypothetical protein